MRTCPDCHGSGLQDPPEDEADDDGSPRGTCSTCGGIGDVL
ncbi:hypothetical protein [Actinokineospora sp. PR83]|nr:hypothetical protein [Actinokineospora sp. PR83]